MNNVIISSRRVVDVRPLLREDQQKKLGTTRRQVEPVCDCPTCTCDIEWYDSPNPYMVEDAWFSRLKEELGYEQVALLVQHVFDSCAESASGQQVVHIDMYIRNLENQPNELFSLLSRLTPRDTPTPQDLQD